MQRTRYKTPDVRAYNLLQQGVALMQSGYTEAGIRGQKKYAQMALELDPNYAAAHAELGWSRYNLWQFKIDDDPMLRTIAISDAERALELEPTNGSAHNLLVEVAMNEGRWSSAEARVRRALAANPEHGPLRHNFAVILASTNRLSQALTEAQRANQLDPFIFWPTIAIIHLANGDFQKAVARLEFVHRNGAPFAWAPLVYTYSSTDREDDALEMFSRLDYTRNVQPVQEAIARRDLADTIVATVEAAGRRCPTRPSLIGITGDRERFFECVSAEIDSNRSAFLMLKNHPAYDAFRDDPRFDALLKRVNLAGP